MVNPDCSVANIQRIYGKQGQSNGEVTLDALQLDVCRSGSSTGQLLCSHWFALV